MDAVLTVMVDASSLIGHMAGIGRYTHRLITELDGQLGDGGVVAYVDTLQVSPSRLLLERRLPHVAGRHILIPKSPLVHLW